VSDAISERRAETRFTLAPPPPVRSLAISAVAALIAVVMIVLRSALDLPAALSIAAIVVMIFAIVLALVALVLTVRLRTTLILDSRSITIIRRRHRTVVSWSRIDRVKMQGARLLLITEPEDDPDVAVVNPRGSDDATFAALVAEIQRRLNADRGYRPIS
jgi:hypothetical protein